MKSARLRAILDIVTSKNIETQGQLMQELSDRGIRSTQATLSRDLKELRLVKELTPEGGYRYAVTQEEDRGFSERLRKIFRESVVSCEPAMNLVVIKTLPGLAMAASSAVDGMGFEELVGTVAGDDTIFVAMRDVKSAERLCEEIKSLF